MKTTKILTWMIDLSLLFLAEWMSMRTMICYSEEDNDIVAYGSYHPVVVISQSSEFKLLG
jgi:hypothetical protein